MDICLCVGNTALPPVCFRNGRFDYSCFLNKHSSQISIKSIVSDDLTVGNKRLIHGEFSFAIVSIFHWKWYYLGYEIIDHCFHQGMLMEEPKQEIV